MKRGIALLALCGSVIAVVAGAAENPWERKLPFEQATITYELSGMETGTETLYIRDYGRETARYRNTRTSMLGMTSKNVTVEITGPDWIYTFDLTKGSGTKAVNPRKIMTEEYAALPPAEQEQVVQNAKKFGTSVLTTVQGDVELNATEVLGYSCDRTSVMGSTTLTIHGTPIVLRSESNLMGISMKTQANAVDTGAVEDSYFRLPEGIEPQPDPEADRMNRVMAEQTIAMLKDPAAYKEENQGKMGLLPGQEEIPEEDQRQMEEAMKALKGLFGN